MTQDFLCQAKSNFRRNTVCISRKFDKAWHKKDESGGASEVLEQIYYTSPEVSEEVYLIRR